jgi:hypothetical protein
VCTTAPLSSTATCAGAALANISLHIASSFFLSVVL